MNLSDHLSLPEQQIRELAYQIWESEGKPHGQAARHWDIACKLAAESLAQAPAPIVKKPKARKATAAAEAIAPAAAASITPVATAAPAVAKAPRSRKASVAPQAGDAEAPAVKPARKSRTKSPAPDTIAFAPEAKRAEPELNNTEPQPG